MAKAKKTVKAPTKEVAPAESSAAPKKSGFPVILVVIGILCILCAGATVLGVFLINRAKRSAGDSLEDGLRNLLEKGVENAIEDRVEDGTGGDSDLSLDGELPNDFPSDVPTYPNAEIGYSSSTTTDGKNSIWVNFTSEDVSKDINDFYVDELEGEGWEITSESQFLAYTIEAEKDGRTISLWIADSEDGGSYYTLTITEE